MENENIEDVETIESTEEQELDLTLDDTEDVEALKTKIAEKDTFARQVLARAKKAEAELKVLKGNKPAEATQTLTPNAPATEELEVLILKSQGMSPELIETLKKVSQATGKTLLDTQKDEVFITIKEKMEATEKSAKASVGASRGSGKVTKVKDINTPGITTEEHKELWLKEQGR